MIILMIEQKTFVSIGAESTCSLSGDFDLYWLIVGAERLWFEFKAFMT